MTAVANDEVCLRQSAAGRRSGKHLEAQELSVNQRFRLLNRSGAERSMGNKTISSLSIPGTQATPKSHVPLGEEAKRGFRTKTVATRLTPDELAEIQTATEGAGQALSEWLRETVLRAARQERADPEELVLAEVWAVRYALLNLFHAAAQAAAEGRPLLPDSILKIRDQADARKLQQARKLLEDFFALEGKEKEHMP
jgi:mobilization protein NikA